MHPRVVAKLLGIFLMLFSLAQVPPGIFAWFHGEWSTLLAFVATFFATICCGFALWLPSRKVEQAFSVRDGMLVVTGFWFILGAFGSLPFYLDTSIAFTLVDAWFESVSGLTTTGATIVDDIESLPISILYYRQQLQWLGGMGIVMLAVAILPAVDSNSNRLIRAETSRLYTEQRVTMKMRETAKSLWLIYLGLTVLCFLALRWAGMDSFDALNHSFSTVSIGGFSTHTASIAYFDSVAVEMIIMVFMVIASMNFYLHLIAWNGFSLKPYLKSAEVLTFLIFFAIFATLLTAYLVVKGVYDSPWEGLRHGAFQALSALSTTGFNTAETYHWGGFSLMLIVIASSIGACSGSVGGGIKVDRFLILFKESLRQLKNTVHPSLYLTINIGKKTFSDRSIIGIWGFLSLYLMSFIVIMLALLALDLDLTTAFSATAAAINNLGPGSGAVSGNYASIPAAAKSLLSLAMIMGRLELVTLLAVFSRYFWRY